MKTLSKEILATEQLEEDGDSICTIKYGVKHWSNSKGQHHRVNGPAYESLNNEGHVEYWQNGVRHRTDGPAVVCPRLNSKLYFIDGNEIEPKDFVVKETAVNGAITYRNALGQLHRKNGPAYIYGEYKEYCQYGRLHREDGPAIERANGQNSYCLNGTAR